MRFRKELVPAVATLVLLGIYVVVSWVGAARLIMPPRQPLRPWNQEELSHPGTFGMRIERGTTARGTPDLMCIPDGRSGDPSPRGLILRRQLEASQVSLRPFGEISGTVVLLHGWGMRKEDLLPSAERFCAVGFRCLLPDLPGHGDNPLPLTGFGSGPNEGLLPGEVMDSAAAKFHFYPRPAVVWGLSMGGAFATQAAAVGPQRWDALIVVSSFDALEPVVCGELDHAARGLATLLDPGLTLAIRCRGGFWLRNVRPVDRARTLHLPVLMVHGASDDVVPFQSGRRLFEAIPDPRKRWLPVAGALHRNVLGTPQPVFAGMATWILEKTEPGLLVAKIGPRAASRERP